MQQPAPATDDSLDLNGLNDEITRTCRQIREESLPELAAHTLLVCTVEKGYKGTCSPPISPCKLQGFQKTHLDFSSYLWNWPFEAMTSLQTIQIQYNTSWGPLRMTTTLTQIQSRVNFDGVKIIAEMVRECIFKALREGKNDGLLNMLQNENRGVWVEWTDEIVLGIAGTNSSGGIVSIPGSNIVCIADPVGDFIQLGQFHHVRRCRRNHTGPQGPQTDCSNNCRTALIATRLVVVITCLAVRRGRRVPGVF